MAHSTRKRALSGVLPAAMVAVFAFSSVAYADNMVPNGDLVAPINLSTLNFGTPCVGAPVSRNVEIGIVRADTLPDVSNSRIFGNGATVTVALTAPITDSPDLTASMTDSTVVLPATWTTTALGTLAADTAIVSVTLTPSATGSPATSRTVNMTATGPNTTGGTTTRTINDLKVTWNAINCDTTPPVITPTVVGTPGLNGWYTSDVTVSWTVVDNESTISSTSGCGPTTINTDTAGTTLTCTATSAGGTASNSVTIKRDATPPIATATASPTPNLNGWNNSDVTVSFTGSDAMSGFASCDADVVLSTEGADQSASGTCTDLAGNVSTLATASNIDIDKTDPTVALVGGPANGGTYTFGSVPSAPTCSASDALSGIDGACSVSGYSAAVGPHTVTASATDKADNTNSASATYTVNPYNFTGFFQPIDIGPTLNSVKAGQAIPVKFSLGGNQGLGIFGAGSPSSIQITCPASAPIDPVEQTVTDTRSSLSYDAATDQYVYVWKTDKSWSGQCRQLTVTLSDGTPRTANFQFK